MAPRSTQSGGLARDIGRAALFAVPLAVLAAWGWVEWRAPDDAAYVAPVVLAAEPSSPALAPQVPAPAPAASDPFAGFYGIKRPASAPPPAPVPERPLAQARPADGGWEARAIPPPAVRAGAYVAIVIDDLGMDPARTARLASLPGPLTFAFLSYAPDIDGQSRAARGRGHEILLHMPMEPEGREDPGPGALRVALSDDDIRARTAAALDRLPLALGLNNHMGSRFTRDPRAMRPVLEELASRGLLFLDS
ncbi:MAG: divergent polysaccharide deacetylase family protein, partial [Tagaea sp.]